MESYTISDTAGANDKLNILDTTHDNLHIAFNIAKNGTNITEDSLMILDDTNYAKWQDNMNDSTIAGININGTDISAIETIKASDGKYLTTIQLDALKLAVAGWLDSAVNGVENYTDVADALSKNSAALISFINSNTNWQSA